ncbi:MAG: AAA family ATPase [Deltaproteobacteria bacterium]|nr:MAG: AAA family ATPase [Deltaproteobacteria bacterium]
MSNGVSGSASALRAAIAAAGKGLIEREPLVELIALAAVAGEHLLVIGPPGTAKSEAVRRVARALDARYFEYLLGRFTEPSEVFGPVDLRKLKEGLVETETRGMLPEAEVAFLDEVFLGSTAILNTLLSILNERTFARGHTRKDCPLRVCVGASNALPHDEQLAAFADRFLVRIFLEPIADPRLEELLEGGWGLGSGAPEIRVSVAELDQLSSAARATDLSAVRPLLAHALRVLRGAGVVLSDRRSVRVQRLVAAAGVLAGRGACTAADLWPIIYAVPTAEGQRTARASLRDLLEASANDALPAAAEEASQGPLARAARIAAFGRELLAARPPDGRAAELQAWSVKLEGIAREIDAGFVKDHLPPELRELRTSIVEIMAAR